MVDSIDVHELMEEFVLLEAVGHCVRADSCLKQLFMYDATGFLNNISGYCFLILKFPVVPPQMPKSRGYKKNFPARLARRMYPHFQKRGAALALALAIG